MTSFNQWNESPGDMTHATRAEVLRALAWLATSSPFPLFCVTIYMGTLPCYVFACIFVCFHICADIYGICVSVSLYVYACPDNAMKPCMDVYGIQECVWICLTHSKCSINCLA